MARRRPGRTGFRPLDDPDDSWVVIVEGTDPKELRTRFCARMADLGFEVSPRWGPRGGVQGLRDEDFRVDLVCGRGWCSQRWFVRRSALARRAAGQTPSSPGTSANDSTT